MQLVPLEPGTELADAVLMRPPRFLRSAGLLAALLIVCAIAWSYVTQVDDVVRCAVRIRSAGTAADLTSPSGEALCAAVSGRVAEVCVAEGDSVAAGATVARLDTTAIDEELAAVALEARTVQDEAARLRALLALIGREHESAMAKAQADVAHARQELRAEEARAAHDAERRKLRIEVAELELARLDRELRAMETMHRHGSAAQVEVLRAREAAAAASARLREAQLRIEDAGPVLARERLRAAESARELLERQYAVRSGELGLDLLRRDAELERFQAELASLERRREQHRLCAPGSGILTRLPLERGQRVEAGSAVAFIAAERALRVDAVVPASQIGRIATGMRARVKLDAFDFQKYGAFDATVATVAPDSQLLDGQVPYYLVQLSVAQTRLPSGAEARLGMTGHAEILTDNDRLLWVLLRSLREHLDPAEPERATARGGPVVGTDAFASAAR